MKLYELRSEYVELRDLAQQDTIDEDQRQAFEDTLTGLRGEIVDKIHACCIVARELAGEAEALRAEEERLARRRNALESNADRLRAYMTVEMAVLEMRSIRTPLFAVTLQANKPKLVIQDDATIPDALCRLVRKPDNQAVRDALERGEKITGAHLEPSQSVRIR